EMESLEFHDKQAKEQDLLIVISMNVEEEEWSTEVTIITRRITALMEVDVSTKVTSVLLSTTTNGKIKSGRKF
ncbi:hypothetical protein Tco_1057313, partial [Tanacetum coccineum]